MGDGLVPDDYTVPTAFSGPGFRLEPLGPAHNERDHAAWMSSIDHIRSTPGMEGRDWPAPMTVEENLADMEMHAREFTERRSFAYSILDGDEVVGCLYIDPSDAPGTDAHVRSWVTASRSDLDPVVRSAIRGWLDEVWPFRRVDYADGVSGSP